MKIAIGCDHGAYTLKKTIVSFLEKKGYTVKDFGCFNPGSCDYPDFCGAAAKAVASGECQKGIVLCTTGIGASISANKVRGIRCACVSDCYSAKMTRKHNDANMLAMGARVVGADLGRMIAEIFLTTDFEGGRHQRRVDQIMAIEAGEDLTAGLES